MKGVRDDANKLSYRLFPPPGILATTPDNIRAVHEIRRVANKAACSGKYPEHNWVLGMKWSRVYDAICRHREKYYLLGESVDQESGCHHLAHVCWGLIVLLYYSRHELGYDDRPPVGLYTAESFYSMDSWWFTREDTLYENLHWYVDILSSDHSLPLFTA